MTGRLSKRSEDRPPDGEFGAIAQLGERLHGMQEVDGLSNAPARETSIPFWLDSRPPAPLNNSVALRRSPSRLASTPLSWLSTCGAVMPRPLSPTILPPRLSNEEIEKKLNSAVFPGAQGGPLMHVIAAKAVCFKEALEPGFKDYQAQVIRNAKAMAEVFAPTFHGG